MERLERQMDENVLPTLSDHEARIRALEQAVKDIRHSLRDMTWPPRWVQTLLLGLLVVKEFWPALVALVRGG
jgi:hypothetical protein